MTEEDIEYIINVLRRGTTTWAGRTRCINSRRYQALNPATGNMVWWRDCDKCGMKTMIKDGLLEVDHIERIGGFTGCWDDLVRKMYCGDDNLQTLCVSCHARKSAVENAQHRFKRKSKAEDSL